MRSCSSSPFQCPTFWCLVSPEVRFEVEVEIGEDWEYEEYCVVVDPHPLLGVAHAEDEDVEDGGDKEDDEDAQGHHEGSLGQSHWIRWLAKLARV